MPLSSKYAVRVESELFMCGEIKISDFFFSFYQPRQKLHKRNNILLDAGAFQGSHIGIAFFNRDDGPVPAAGRQHRVHEETPNASVSVHVRMDIHKYKMPKHGPHGGFGFIAQKVEKDRHEVAHGFPTWRKMHGPADINLPV